MKGFFILSLCAAAMAPAQQKDTVQVSEIREVTFTRQLPVAKDIIDVQKDLGQKNLGQDLPILLKNQASVTTTSDAGNGVGYTGFRIRGVGGSGINIMLNGVPYNDSESQGTYFVDVPDLAGAASQIVIQRGVGTSSNGAAAFGASVNIISKNPDEKFSIKTDDSYGSFNTHKYSAEINTGKFWQNRLSLMGRYTKIHSDGYIDRAFSNLGSYNLTALYEQDNTKIRMMAFGGKEKTYQAWNGVDRATWDANPRFNYSGALYDAAGQISGYYPNETDNYRQSHLQLLWQQSFSEKWNLATTLHYTKGKGYYENYMQGATLADYGLPEISGEANEDLIRKKWLNNDFYGATSTLYGKAGRADLNFGIVANQYYGRHYGDVSGAQPQEIRPLEYYRNRAVKDEAAGFAKVVFRKDRLEFFGDVQLRAVAYKSVVPNGSDGDAVSFDDNWLFFNPKAGLSYRIDGGKVFLSYAHAHREPNRDDLVANPATKPERLHDYEAGAEEAFGKVRLSGNLYYMDYRDQLVLSGRINEVGAFTRENSGQSYRLGAELAVSAKLSKQWDAAVNITLSRNTNINFRDDGTGSVVDYGNTPISFSPRIIGNFLLNYSLNGHLALGLQNQYTGRQFLDNTGQYSHSIAPALITDFSAGYTLAFPHYDVRIKLILNNIFNKNYANNGYVASNVPYYFPQAGINFLSRITLVFK